MLLSLHIKDFAIIDELELSLGPGLNVMTGETGAGKTIIVEALKLVMGGRASTDIVRSGSERASATAVFDAAGLMKEAKEILDAAGIEYGEELILHRTVCAQGKGRISINGIPTTAAILKSVAWHLVDISSQHEHQLLLDESMHPYTLDSFGGTASLSDSFRDAHRRYSLAARELFELEANERAAKERLDFLKFQLDEINAADLKPNEDSDIEAERSRVKHAVLLQEKAIGAEAILAGEAGVAAAIDRACHLLAACAPYEPRVQQWSESLDSARIEASDVARELSFYAEGLDSDPARLEELEDRLHKVRALARKHGGSVESCFARRDELAAELERIANYDELIDQKREELSCLLSERRAAAEKLSAARKKAARIMGEGVARELAELGMPKTQFAVVAEPRPEGEWDDSGPDRVELLISPNPGEPMRELSRIASGGELSRVMLALKGALLSGGSLAGTSIFDEVDSGIGGAVAAAVGKKLKRLSSTRQVVCITHLPQVAACADRHLRICKRTKSGRTVTTMEDLPGTARVTEIARMLGGEEITNAAVKHAEEMLAQANNEQKI